MASPSKKFKSENLGNPPSKAAISKGNRRSRTVSSQKLPLQLEDDVPDFPRGGGRSFRKEEIDDVGAILDNELEADQRLLEKRKKGKKVQNRNQPGEDDLGSLFGDGIMGKLPRFSNRITLKRRDLGRDTTSWELLRKTHMTKDGSFVDARSHAIDVAMQGRVAQETQAQESSSGSIPEPLPTETVNQIYLDVAGGVKKGRVYGLRTQTSGTYPVAMTPRPRGASTGGLSSAATEELRAVREEVMAAGEKARVAFERADRAYATAIEAMMMADRAYAMATEAMMRADRAYATATEAMMRADVANQECTDLRARIENLEKLVNRLLGGLPPPGPSSSRF